MVLLDFLDRVFGNKGQIDLATHSRASLKNAGYKILAVESAISLIAKTLARAEIQTYENGKEVKKLNYYMLNVEANKNCSAFLFWEKVMRKLTTEGEALVLLQDGQMFLADSFERKNSVFVENLYVDIVIDDYELRDTWEESNVLYLEDNNERASTAVNLLYSEYVSLISASVKGYQNSKARKGKLKIPTNLPKTLQEGNKLQEHIQKSMKDFMDPTKDAVYPETGGFEYTEITDAQGSKSNDSGRETKNFINDVFDFIAISRGIPPALLTGDTVDTKDAVNNFIAFCIRPWADKIQSEINRKMYGYELYAEQTYAKVDTSTIKIVDLRDIANSIDLLNRNGAVTIDDTLRALGKEPIGGDLGCMRFITKNLELLDNILGETKIEEG